MECSNFRGDLAFLKVRGLEATDRESSARSVHPTLQVPGRIPQNMRFPIVDGLLFGTRHPRLPPSRVATDGRDITKKRSSAERLQVSRVMIDLRQKGEGITRRFFLPPTESFSNSITRIWRPRTTSDLM